MSWIVRAPELGLVRSTRGRWHVTETIEEQACEAGVRALVAGSFR